MEKIWIRDEEDEEVQEEGVVWQTGQDADVQRSHTCIEIEVLHPKAVFGVKNKDLSKLGKTNFKTDDQVVFHGLGDTENENTKKQDDQDQNNACNPVRNILHSS